LVTAALAAAIVLALAPASAPATQVSCGFGIEAVPGVTDGGGNKASGNGNPLQCLNVFCR
jgi:uncharacterized membrane protein